MNPDPYRVLGVPSTASQTQITHAYRDRLRAHHPDTRSPQAPAAADEGLQQVLAAYALLRDPTRRAAYDQRVAGRAGTHSGSGAIKVPITYRHGKASESNAPSPDLWVGPVRRHRSRSGNENPSGKT
jgi:curved DNA-binding protein CbpA